MAFTESEVIALLAQVFASSHPNLEVGIGDDAAVIRTTNRTVITTDMAVEGVHFRLEWSSPFEIGRKITAANLADVFSMGAKPTFLVVAVSLTGNEDLEWIEKLAKGIAFEANLVGAAVVGGDLAKGAAVTIAITALGEVETAIYNHDAIAEACVFGIPEERLGEEVAAVIVLRPGRSLSEKELQDFLSGTIAKHKIPTKIWFRDEPIPRNASGKFLKRELKKELTGE